MVCLVLLLAGHALATPAPVTTPPAPDPQQFLLQMNQLRARLANLADAQAPEDAKTFLATHLANPQALALIDSFRDRHLNLGQPQEGAAALAELARKHPQTPGAAYALYHAGLLMKSGGEQLAQSPSQALAYLLEAAAAQPGGYGGEARLEAARLYLEQDALHEGLNLLTRLLEQKNADPYLRERALRLAVDSLLAARLQDEALALASNQMKQHADLPSLLAYADVMERTGKKGLLAFLKKNRGNHLQQPAFAQRYLQAAEAEDSLTPELDDLTAHAQTPELSALAQALGQMDRTLDQLRVVEALVSREPGNVNHLLAAARLYVQNNFLADAERTLAQLLPRAPMQEAWRLKARLALAKGEAAAASEAYEKAAGFNPAEVASFERLAAMRLEDGDLSGSIQVYHQGREAHKNQGLFRLPLGRALELNLMWEDALAEYLAALGDPTLQAAATARLQTLLTGEPALKDRVADVFASLPMDPTAKLRAKLLLAVMVRDLDHALAAARNLQQNSPSEEVLLNLAQQQMGGDFPELAEALLTDRLNQPAPPALAQLSLARLKSKLGKHEEALAGYNGLQNAALSPSLPVPVGLMAQMEKLLVMNALGLPLENLATQTSAWFTQVQAYPGLLVMPLDQSQRLLDLFISLGKTSEANALLAANPAMPQAHRDWAWGMVLFLQGKTEEAQKHLMAVAERADARYSNDALRLMGLAQYSGEVLNNDALVEGIRLSLGGRHREAVARLSTIQPADPFSLLYWALSSDKLGQGQQAAEMLVDRLGAVDAVFGPMLLFEATRLLHAAKPNDPRLSQWVQRLEEDYPNNIYKEAGRRLLSPAP